MEGKENETLYGDMMESKWIRWKADVWLTNRLDEVMFFCRDIFVQLLMEAM